MLMHCEKCGKLFDYQENHGKCPACGRYHALPKQPEPTPAEYERSKHSRKARTQWKPEPAVTPRQLRRMQVLCTVLLVLFPLLLFLSHLRTLNAREEWESSAWADGPVNYVAVGQEFPLRGRVVQIGDVEKMPQEYQVGVPEGRVLLRLPLKTLGDIDYDSTIDDVIYLQITGEDGLLYYYECLSSYDMEHIYPALAEETLDDDALQRLASQDGWIYFSIPQNARDLTLCVDHADREEYSGPRTPIAVYQIELSGWAAESEVSVDE